MVEEVREIKPKIKITSNCPFCRASLPVRPPVTQPPLVEHACEEVQRRFENLDLVLAAHDRPAALPLNRPPQLLGAQQARLNVAEISEELRQQFDRERRHVLLDHYVLLLVQPLSRP